MCFVRVVDDLKLLSVEFLCCGTSSIYYNDFKHCCFKDSEGAFSYLISVCKKNYSCCLYLNLDKFYPISSLPPLTLTSCSLKLSSSV